MRIISGILKGRKIDYLKNHSTRPLKDSVKESIFNILIHSDTINVKLERSNVLDLYSGVGSFGIECISRGAQNVTFIEKDKFAYHTLKENLQNLSIINKTKIFNDSIEEIIKKKFNIKFDIFFLDPPFKDYDFIKNLMHIKRKNMFKTNHIVIIHREAGTTDNLTDTMNIINIKEYGRSKIIFGLLN
tara:strand:+ start:460 stop:1020 length:561 start_codon:yes stop_codon:yes gene_type:complete